MSLEEELKLAGLIDRMIHRLQTDQNIDGFTDDQVLTILDEAHKTMRPIPALIEMDAPLVIFGDVHGQFGDLRRFLELVGTPPKTRILFLGDYVDRCKNSIEVIMLLICFKLKYPSQIELLRGNHECAKMNRCYGFYEECRRKRSILIWKHFQMVFDELPLCASINKRIFCCHGGLSPDIKSWESLKHLPKPRSHNECEQGIPVDLMWADPFHDTCLLGWQLNKVRNASYMFGNDVIAEFCQMLDIDLIVRAHEAVKDGHAFSGERNQLCTIFSAPNYCGIDGNSASVLKVNEKLECSFVTLKPRLDLSKLSAEARIEFDKVAATTNAKSPLPSDGKLRHQLEPDQSLESKMEKTLTFASLKTIIPPLTTDNAKKAANQPSSLTETSNKKTSASDSLTISAVDL